MLLIVGLGLVIGGLLLQAAHIRIWKRYARKAWPEIREQFDGGDSFSRLVPMAPTFDDAWQEEIQNLSHPVLRRVRLFGRSGLSLLIGMVNLWVPIWVKLLSHVSTITIFLGGIV